MNTMSIFIIFICILTTLFLILNFLFAQHNPYQEKYSIFECGFHSFLGQNRTQFGIKFYIFSLLYLIFDLEIFSVLPYTMTVYSNSIYGLSIALIFILIVTIGFVYELGKNALKLYSKQQLIKLINEKNLLNKINKNI